MPITEKVDVLISGLGPTGALTARYLANLMKDDKTHSILAIDRKKEIGKPVYCGEFMPTVDEMKNLMPEVQDPEVFRIDDKYYYTRTKKIVFIDPKGRERETQFDGYSFNRSKWLHDTVEGAKNKGVKIMTDSSLVSYNFQENKAVIRHDGDLKFIEPKVLVCSEGYRSITARASELMLYRKNHDFVLTSGFQIAKNLQNNPEEVFMYFGKLYSPGAYAWIIPKGNNTANIGMGARMTHRTGETLSQVMSNLFHHPHAKNFLEGAEVSNKMGKPVPVGLPPRVLVRRNVVGIGDAVNQVISAVGAGIPPAMVSSDLLSKAIINELSGKGSLKKYEVEVEMYVNPAIRRSWKLRRIFDKISDTDSRFLKYFKFLSANDVNSVTQARLNLKLRLLVPFIPIGNLIFR
ncbi:MAG: hypothetical protein ACXAEU_02010 [Candidatus Hodarchaeales archaeon]|jgi:geranylgeranyl reductase family protein